MVKKAQTKAASKNKDASHGNSKYKEEYAEQAYRLALLGMIDTEMCKFFQVSRATLNLWKEQHEEFGNKLREGKEIADGNVVAALYKRATGYEHEADHIHVNGKGEQTIVPYIKRYPPDTQAIQYFLCNRQRGKWKMRNELTGADGGPIEVKDSTLEETARKLAFLFTAGAKASEDD